MDNSEINRERLASGKYRVVEYTGEIERAKHSLKKGICAGFITGRS